MSSTLLLTMRGCLCIVLLITAIGCDQNSPDSDAPSPTNTSTTPQQAGDATATSANNDPLRTQLATPQGLAEYVYDCVQREDFEAFKLACISETDLQLLLNNTEAQYDRDRLAQRLEAFEDGTAELMLQRGFYRVVHRHHWSVDPLVAVSGSFVAISDEHMRSLCAHSAHGEAVRIDSPVKLNGRWVIGDDGPLGSHSTYPHELAEEKIADIDPARESILDTPVPEYWVCEAEVAIDPWPGWPGHDPDMGAREIERLKNQVAHAASIGYGALVYDDPALQTLNWHTEQRDLRGVIEQAYPAVEPRPSDFAAMRRRMFGGRPIPGTLRATVYVITKDPDEARLTLEACLRLAVEHHVPKNSRPEERVWMLRYNELRQALRELEARHSELESQLDSYNRPDLTEAQREEALRIQQEARATELAVHTQKMQIVYCEDLFNRYPPLIIASPPSEPRRMDATVLD